MKSTNSDHPIIRSSATLPLTSLEEGLLKVFQLLLREEISRGRRLHGKLTQDSIRAALILGEECGEVSRAALELTRPGASAPTPRLIAEEHLMAELTQVAAVAAQMYFNVMQVKMARGEESRLRDTLNRRSG